MWWLPPVTVTITTDFPVAMLKLALKTVTKMIIVANLQTIEYQLLRIRKHAGLHIETVAMPFEGGLRVAQRWKSLPTAVSGFTNWITSESQSHQAD